MNPLNYEKGKLTYADNGVEINFPAILFDKETGIILKYGEKSEIEQYYENALPIFQEITSPIYFDVLSKEDSYVIITYFMTRTCGNRFLSFLAANEEEQRAKIQEMKVWLKYEKKEGI